MLAMRPYTNAAVTIPWTTSMTVGGMLAVCAMRQPGAFKRVERAWAVALAWMWGMRVDVAGLEHWRPGQPYVVMVNHQSLVDIPALVVALPVVPTFVAKQELGRVPVMAWVVRFGGHVLVERGNVGSARRMMSEAARLVRGGKTLVIFPEGTRGEADVIAPFKKGGFLLAKQAKAPILPIGIRGTREILPKHALGVKPGVLQVRIGPPIAAEQVASMRACELMERTRSILGELSGMPLSS